MDKGNFLVVILILVTITIFFAFVEAKVAPKMVQQTSPNLISTNSPIPINPILPDKSCSAMQNLPVPQAPSPQMSSNVRIFDNLLVYDLLQQQSYSQPSLFILDIGADGIFSTPDDKPLQSVFDSLDTRIIDFDLSGENLVWIRDANPWPFAELRMCGLDACASNASELIFTKDNMYDLESKLTISGSRIAWTVHDLVNPTVTKIMFCDITKNGANGGCLATDKKQVMDLSLQLNEYVNELRTTEKFGYVLTKTYPLMPVKLYIIDYDKLTFSVYYDEQIDKEKIVDFHPVNLQQQNYDAMYILENNNSVVSVAIITDGKERFSNRGRILANKIIDSIVIDRNGKSMFEFAYRERDSNGSNYYIKKMSPPKSYTLDKSYYQQMGMMSYSKNSFVTINQNSLPAYMHCF